MVNLKKCISALLSTVIIAGSLIATPMAASAATADASVSASQTSKLKSGLVKLTKSNVEVVLSKTCGRLEATPNGTKVFVEVEKIRCDGKDLQINTDYSLKYYDTGVDNGHFAVYVCGIGKYYGVVQKYFDNTFKPKFINASWKVQRESNTIIEQARLAGKSLKRDVDYTFKSHTSFEKIANFSFVGKGEYAGYTVHGSWRSETTMLNNSNTKVSLSTIDGYWDTSINAIRRCERVILQKENGKTVCLQKDQDYVLDYFDKSTGNAYRAKITGINSYDGIINTEYVPFTSSSSVNFVWGRDNWGFNNSKGYSDFANYQKSEGFNNFTEQIKNAQKNFTDIEIQKTKESIDSKIKYNNSKGYSHLKGICEGMSNALIFSKLGIFTDPIHVQGDDRDATIISKNSFMHGFLGTNIYYSFNKRETVNSNCTQATKIASIEKELENNSLVKLTYELYKIIEGKKVKTGHAVVAYGTEDCNYYSDVTKKDYDRRILICDPNSGEKDRISNLSCLYYNSADYSWIIPSQNSSSSICYGNSIDDTSNNSAETGSISKAVKYSPNNNLKSIAYTNVENVIDTYISDVKAKNNNVLIANGDINRDGAVDKRDESFLRKIILSENCFELKDLNVAQKSLADLYKDNIIDRHDMYKLQRLIYDNCKSRSYSTTCTEF